MAGTFRRFQRILSLLIVFLFLCSVSNAEYQQDWYFDQEGFTANQLNQFGGDVFWPADFATNGPARYTPFGALYRPSSRTYDGDTLTSLKFTGKEYDPESRLSNFGARFLEHEYPPRFITADPSLSRNFQLDNPQTFNLYTYGLNNPVRYTDPTGECFWDVLDVISFGISVGSFVAAPGLATGIDLALDTVGLLPGVPGIGTVRHGIDLVDAGYDVIKRTDDVSEVGKATKKVEDLSQTGSYTNLHESEKTYYGKGTQKRSQQSGRRQARENDDPHIATDWTPADNPREAFKQE